MFNLEVKSKLTFQQRIAVDRLIFEVWSHEQKTKADVEMLTEPGDPIFDPLDRKAIHVLVFEDKKVVGYGRLSLFLNAEDRFEAPSEVPFEDASRTAYISRLVVHPSARGRGIGTLIDEARISIAKAHGIETLVGCAVGLQRCESLKKVGFDVQKPVHLFENPWYRTSRPVRVMRMHLHPTDSIFRQATSL